MEGVDLEAVHCSAVLCLPVTPWLPSSLGSALTAAAGHPRFRMPREVQRLEKCHGCHLLMGGMAHGRGVPRGVVSSQQMGGMLPWAPELSTCSGPGPAERSLLW